MVPSRQHMTRVAGDGVSLGPAGLTGVCHGDYLAHLSGQGRCRSALTKFREPLIECRAVVTGFDIERDAEQAGLTFVDPDARFLVVWPKDEAESRLFLGLTGWPQSQVPSMAKIITSVSNATKSTGDAAIRANSRRSARLRARSSRERYPSRSIVPGVDVRASVAAQPLVDLLGATRRLRTSCR